MSAFQNYFVDTLKNRYADFSGRATRSEFWYFQLFQILLLIIPYVLMMAGMGSMASDEGGMAIGFAIGGGLVMLMGLAFLVPSISVLVRRLHDTGRSGWFYFIALIPLVGGFILLFFLCSESKPGTNKWGSNPFETDSGNIADHLVD